MFAVAIWDRQAQTLTLARDRFGQKPLYVARPRSPGGSRLVFGSEPKSLLASGLVSRSIDWAAVHEFAYFGSTLGERTTFAEIRRLEAGHVLTMRRDGEENRAFFRVEDVATQHDDLEVATSRVRELLASAVERHTVSDVPVGVFLSGGIDSSAITMLAGRKLGRALRSYSVGFDDETGELPLARKVALEAGTTHEELRVRGADIASVVEALAHHHDQPFGDAANVPLYLLAKALGGGVKVVLQGDGGDEIFAGYRRYPVLALSAVWRAAARTLPLLERAPQHPLKQRAIRFLRAAGESDSATRMALLLTEETRDPSPIRFFSESARRELAATRPFARYDALDARLSHVDPVQRMLHTDVSILLPDIFCEKVDRATMAASLEVRLPFLDTELTDYVLGLPSRHKVRGLEKKRLLRRALRGIVPDSILDAPKRGFGTPYGRWLKGPLRPMLSDVLVGGHAAQDGIVDAEACRQAVAEHVSGSHNHGFILYKMLSFALFYEVYR